ncbi:hypothetical protein PCASD_10013 [Puccinia coronata f. sp. avenae]|uniref:Uncharacterized protein n=1 Tax=Puccinia coronata f. sp. avenae TaxID=200324 RepID=A0A2N5UJL8_9BASI|nr:hypothetical protein PCASD_10013 [Puccinia coronata f. sp. avenae]
MLDVVECDMEEEVIELGPCLSGARTAVFDRWLDGHCPTEARANWLDRFVQPVPAGPVQPVPGTDRTGMSDPAAGASVGQCLSDHRSNTAVQAPLELPCSTGVELLLMVE